MLKVPVTAISAAKPITSFEVAPDMSTEVNGTDLLSKVTEGLVTLSERAKQAHLDITADLQQDATNPLTILKVQQKLSAEGSKVSLLNGVVHKLGSTFNDLLKS